jgi:hypothetical protein
MTSVIKYFKNLENRELFKLFKLCVMSLRGILNVSLWLTIVSYFKKEIISTKISVQCIMCCLLLNRKAGRDKMDTLYSAFTFVLDQSRLWKFGELYGKTVAE